MPQITDQHLIRAILELDRPWAAFALADLEPPYSHFASWFCAEGSRQPAIALVYRGYERPVVICVGDAAYLDPVLDQVETALVGSEQVYAVVKPDVLVSLAKGYRVVELKSMLRMVLDFDLHRMHSIKGVVALSADDLPAVEALYADGNARGEYPEFFVPSMLNDGVYYGAYENTNLVAVAGTHVVASGVREGIMLAIQSAFRRLRKFYGRSSGILTNTLHRSTIG